jgi:hypothetical protein
MVDSPKWAQWVVGLVGFPAFIVIVLSGWEVISPRAMWVALPIFAAVVGIHALAAIGHYEGYRNG